MAQGLSSLQSALTVGGFLIALGGPALWWVFFRMDEKPNQENYVPEEIELISEDDILLIENSLDVKLPNDYVEFIRNGRDVKIDNTTVQDSAKLIIEATNEYRNGFAGLPAWPKELIYIGDEADTCPYTINCTSGEVLQTDKGNINRDPLSRYNSFSDFVLAKLAENV
jgi:hypothetical protein